MGMNYYLKTKPCECCNRSDKLKHIGKSSYGWVFSLHVIPDEGIHDLCDWIKFFNDDNYQIYDEEDRQITTEDMLDTILNRSSENEWDSRNFIYSKFQPYHSEEHFHECNQSQRGPNNLLRTKVDYNHCIGHGDGTYDLIIGEFS